MEISIIGGDLRTVKLIKLLAQDKNKIKVWGFENCEELLDFEKKNDNLKIHNNLDEALQNQIIIGPTPFTKDRKYICTQYTNQKLEIQTLANKIRDKLLIGGSVPAEILEQIETIDILKDERLVILNAISTVEGTIEIAIKETQKNLYNSNILIIGYGRIGKILVDRLTAFKANVYCSARGKDITWIEAYGSKSIKYEELNKKIDMFDIIINTVPVLILNKKRLELLNKNTLLIDVASAPGGIDFEVARQLNIKTIWALGIPGKIAPISSAEYIKETIYNIIKERNDNK